MTLGEGLIYIVQCTLYIVQCTEFKVYFMLYSVHCTVYSVQHCYYHLGIWSEDTTVVSVAGHSASLTCSTTGPDSTTVSTTLSGAQVSGMKNDCPLKHKYLV